MEALPINQEALRLKVLERYQILDTKAEGTFDNLAQLAALICGTPIAWINFIDEKRQWLKAKVGWDMPELQLNRGFCPLCIRQKDMLIVPDTLTDEGWSKNLMVTEPPHVRFYAGVPLIGAKGQAIGTLCVMDSHPKKLTPEQIWALRGLARQVMALLEMRQTQQKQLQQSEERLQSTLDIAGMGVWEWNILKQIGTWSNNLERVLGKENGSFDGTYKVLLASIHPEDRERVVQSVLLFLDGEGDRSIDFRILWDDGRIRWMVAQGKLFYDDKGRAVRIIVAFKDITHRQNSFKQLHIFEERLHHLLRLIPAVIYYCEPFGKFAITYISDSIPTILGYESQEFIDNAQFWVDNIHPEDRERVLAERGLLLKVGYHTCEYRFRHQDGSYRWIRDESKLLYKPTGEPLEIMGCLIDNSQSKQIEQELQLTQRQILDYKEELAGSSNELKQFAYFASHNLQEPLRMITSYLQLLEKKYNNKLDYKASEYITYAVDGAKRMQIPIDDLLGFAHVGTRGQPFATVDCDVVLKGAIANLKTDIEESGALIICDPLPKVIADATQLTQVFQNLIANAIKFRSEQPPQIHIGVVPREEATTHITFLVGDNGIGIESRHMKRIFAMFQRLHSRDKYPGTGIGLALCKKIVERHSGIIWVESQLDQGSIFYFTIPDKSI
jgi:PAS domain S-box-containing protein